MTFTAVSVVSYDVRLHSSEPHGNAAPGVPVLALDFDGELTRQPGFSLVGRCEVTESDPAVPGYTGMPSHNRALQLSQAGSYARIEPPAEASWAFQKGDSISIEAWVNVKSIKPNAYAYIVGKGRTYETDRLENQDFALRIVGRKGSASLSFLFSTDVRQADVQGNRPEYQYHRWTTDDEFPLDGSWHHLAVSYRFGEPESMAGFIDGRPVSGNWDMAGPTAHPPVASSEPIWIGSSRGGDPNNSFVGWLDNVRISRSELSPAEVKERRIHIEQPPEFVRHRDKSRVLITLHEDAGSYKLFPSQPPEESFRFSLDELAITRLPVKYLRGGLRDRWRGPVLLRAFVETDLPGGETELLVRSPGLTRLWIDGTVVASTPARKLFPDAHQPFIVYEPDMPWLRVPHAGDRETRVKLDLAAGPHTVILESMVGSSSSRTETGETLVAYRVGGEMFQLLGPASRQTPFVSLTDDAFLDYQQRMDSRLEGLEHQWLLETSSREDDYWERRHELARQVIDKLEPIANPTVNPWLKSTTELDELAASLVDPKIPQKTVQATDELAEPRTLLRRLSLDLRGIPPTALELKEFEQYDARHRTAEFASRFLDDERWADHWTSYWQDVLAENPNILKPSLNNTGPFRWWLHDSLLANKPMDRFVTELVRMQGDSHAGGPAGFGVATQNDVPMAEKGHIIAAAFLAVDLKCARCHDAPYHPWTQKDLFSLGSMLHSGNLTVPATSSVPQAFFDRKVDGTEIQVTLQPGDVVAPYFPRSLLSELELASGVPVLRAPDASSRERLAALITGPNSLRFPRVIANRVWTRIMGWGLVDSTEDWLDASIRCEPLLEYLAREFVRSGYDVKELTRLIVTSRTYQRTAIDPDAEFESAGLAFVAPWIRRMSAEQVVDSLHVVGGRSMQTEPITFDLEASQKLENFLNLGVADRAWQLTSLSNERDRPSLSLPKAAAVAECLSAFGWRSTRQAPVTHREDEANVTQPGTIANSHLTGWVTRLTDDSELTELALQASSAKEFIAAVFIRILSREPTTEEMSIFLEILQPGFDDRRATVQLSLPAPPASRGFATWSNHFDVKANALMRELEREVANGPQPTQRLESEWRQRAEDAIWAVMNAPEFQVIQ
ncbi:MAG: DUF1553 domain-containing protein [Planctomycetales bacterium]|nr:DUF1553 domain-containing protein [Planctomycetales bacterium]